jgi:hypothetical protein
MRNLLNHIGNNEFPALACASLEENGGDVQRTAHDLETMDLMLGVIKMKSLINSRDRNAKSRFSRGRGIREIFGNIILRDKNGKNQ